MSIAPGQQLLHYRLIERIGEGGMGVVWKALDTSLDRDVAIKVLPDDFATDPARLARFEREAKLLATLNHPNVSGIFGLHEAGVRFIAMEFVEGDTLAERIERSALSIEDTLDVGKQIAEALEAAHDAGIVHRDLKPANVKIRPDGTVKVLDFGLARVVTEVTSGDSGPDAPTATAGTGPGMILGTAPYMSPEQARGKPVTKRTDIWALGCLLYECLTGKRAFGGATTTDVLARIVTSEPDFTCLPAGTPAFLVRLIRRCLEKNSRQRLRDAGELRVAIETHGSRAPAAEDAAVRSHSWVPWGLAALLGIAVVYLQFIAGSSVELPPAVSRWTIPLPPETRVDLPGPGGKFDYSNTVAVSRDGSQIAFSVIDRKHHARLYLKSGEATPQPIPGTDNARAPFFSPDGQWLGFYVDGTVRKVALRGGSPQELFDVGGRAISFDAAWSPDGETILFADDGIWRVSLPDGAPVQITQPDPERGELGHHAPRFTTDGTAVVFTVSGPDKPNLAAMRLDGADWQVVVRDATLGTPVGTDRLVFARSGELYAVPFDPDTLSTTGSPVPVLQGVHTSPGLGGMVVTWFDVSEGGTLAFVPVGDPRPDERLVWVDRDGRETLIAEGPGTWVHPHLSPGGESISLDIHTADGIRDVYLYDLGREQFQQLTHTGVTWESEWTAAGDQLAVLSGINPGNWSLYRVRADFSGDPELIAPTDHAVPGCWIDEDRALLFTEWNVGGIYRVQVDDPTPELLLNSDRREGFPQLSPDGHWMAYVAEQASRREVFVQSYPELGGAHKVSIDGGREPVWSNDGDKLFYRNGDRMLMVDVGYGGGISFGRPEVLFEGVYDAAEVGHQHYDISLDGQRFLMVKHGEPSGPREVRVVLHWDAELRALAGGS